MKNKLMYVSQLRENKSWITQTEAAGKYGLSLMKYNSLKSAIPSNIKEKVVTMQDHECFHDEKFRDYMAADKTVAYVYRCLMREANDTPLEVEQKWKAEEIDGIKSHINNIKKSTHVTKYQSFQFRLLHKAIPTNIQLVKWKIKESDTCSYCGVARETIRHLFYECPEVQVVWKELLKTCKQMGLCCEDQLSYQQVICSNVDPNPCAASNFLCTVAKQYIYRQKCLKKSISVKEVSSLFYMCRNVEKYHALKNCSFLKYCKKWNIPSQEGFQEQLKEIE